MRIVVLGDFQFNSSETHLTELAMEDVASAMPNLVITLGDYGSNDVLGKPEGIEQVYSFLNNMGCTIRPILGNHDLQFESGDNKYQHGTMNSKLCDLFSIGDHHGVIELEDFRMFFISTDPQPANSCYYVQECYLSDESFNNIVINLKKRPGIPAIFFSHAPPIGSGLITVPDVHVRATNAFLDQNHDPYRWIKLIKRFPEIILWFSAHYHLGHEHQASISERLGTFFFMNGVHSSVTRDGYRQSRVIDIAQNSIMVRTLDHDKRCVIGTVDWEHNGGLMSLLGEKKSRIKSNVFIKNKSLDNYNKGCVSLTNTNLNIKIVNDFGTGNGIVCIAGVLEAKKGRILAATKSGYLWEIDTEYGEALGTLHYNEPPLQGIAVTGNLVWRIWDNKVGVSELDNPFRFVREANDAKHKSVLFELEEPALFICKDSDLSVLIGSNNKLFEAQFICGDIVINEICVMDNIIKRIECCHNNIYIQTIKNDLYIIDNHSRCAYMIKDKKDLEVSTINDDPTLLDLDFMQRAIADIGYDTWIDNASILKLSENKILLCVKGRLFFYLPDLRIWDEIYIENYKIAAMCKINDRHKIDRICIALNSVEEPQIPRFQIIDIVSKA